VVIDTMAPLMAEICPGDEDIHYDAVDATNYESMAKALAGEKESLLVVTEGLLSYFSQSELETVFTSIRRLLVDHGGSWVIVDVAYHVHGQAMADAILEGSPKAKAMYAAYLAKGSGDMAGVKAFDNDLFTGTEDKAKAFVERMGFDITELPVADYLPDQLPWLASSPGAEERVREVFDRMRFWELTPAQDAGNAQEPDRDLPFAVDMHRAGGTLRVVVQGRLDTITAPDLLERFQEVGGGVDEIVVDARNLSYVSSAGLRVLMMMLKSLDDTDAFTMVNVSRGVREVLEVSGVDEFFL
jgi:anti-anti-sigma factor